MVKRGGASFPEIISLGQQLNDPSKAPEHIFLTSLY
jgi:hypothetical protein